MHQYRQAAGRGHARLRERLEQQGARLQGLLDGIVNPPSGAGCREGGPAEADGGAGPLPEGLTVTGLVERAGELESAGQEECARQQRQAAAQARRAWTDFADAAVGKGGRVAHRISKGPTAPPPVVYETDEQDRRRVPLVGQSALEAELKQWLPI